MSGVRNMAAGLSTFNRVRSAMKGLPLRIRSVVAKDVAPMLTMAVQESYDSGQTAYSTPRPKGVSGAALTLKKTGATRSDIGFVAVGTIVRAVLGRKYQRYLVGKYGVLPTGRLPAKWSEAIGGVIRDFAEDFQREALR